MNAPSPPRRKGRKYEQVLEGARSVFLRDGFDGASVDEIARVAAVSKATLYSYFADKRLLFMEVARQEFRRQADEAVELSDPSATPEVVLAQAARRIISFFVSDFGQRVFRIAVAELHRFPDLGCQFYESGPLLARSRIGAYLRAASERGELAIEDVDLAADQFAELCKAGLFARVVCGFTREITHAEIDRVVRGAVDMFLARYGR